MGSIFKKGYGAVRTEVDRQEAVRENATKKLWRFFLDSKDNTSAEVQFLTEEPINFHEHNIQTVRNGKTTYDSFTCSGDDCKYCANGDKPTFKGAYLIFDRRKFKRIDKKTNKEVVVNGQLRLYVAGARITSQLDRISSRYGLMKFIFEINRNGSGTATTYSFDRLDACSKFTSAEITAMLPEKLRDSFDGSMDSLYKIIEDQLTMNIGGDTSIEDSSEEEEDTGRRNTLVDVDEDEKEEKPAVKKPAKLGSLKRPQNSVKKIFKGK